MLKGIQFGEVKNTIARVFTPSQFDMFLFEQLEFKRSHHVADGPFLEVVGAVLEVFDNEGRDPQLFAAVAAARPLREDVQEIYRKYAQSLLNEAQRAAVDSDKLAVLESYGLSPAVEVQRAGRSQLPAEVPATFEGFQKIIRKSLPMLEPRLWFAQYLRNEQRVCQIEVQRKPVGTGFLVNEDVVLTNYHVLKDAIEARSLGADVCCRFDFRIMNNGAEAAGNLVPLKGDFDAWHIDSSPPLPDATEDAGEPLATLDQLDHALVRLDRPIGSEPMAARGPLRGWIEMPVAPTGLERGGAVMILQHPNGRPVKLAFDTDAILSVNPEGTRVRYMTNTDYGSSGSPCFNLQWGLVALHHFGDPFSKPTRYNQGIPAEAIRKRLARDRKEEVLGGEPPID
ncbi:trypsin-like peptidase domain-containing protein [Isosphaeraceae bacterium EP7]